MSHARPIGPAGDATIRQLADAGLVLARDALPLRRLYRCKCRDCDKTWEYNQGNRGLPPPDLILKRARRDGWVVNYGRRPRCPEHAVNPARYRTVTIDTPPPAPVTRPLTSVSGVALMAPQSPAQIAQPSMKLVRQVMVLLEENFDETERRYRPGWSDEKIAADTGVSLVQVAKVRVEAFGELAADPAIAKLRDELAEHELKCEELLQAGKALASKLESFIAARKIGG